MKLKKISATVLILLFFTFSVLYSQDKELKEKPDKNIQENNQVKIHEQSVDQHNVTEKKSDIPSEVSEPLNKKKKVPAGNKSENQKSSEKDIPDNFNYDKADEDILLINEGNFKYKRIPEIKLIEKKVEQTDAVAGSENPEGKGSASDSPKTTGLFGLGKTASDIIVKGGALLIILLILILYKSRMSVPGGKSSRSRKVLNSFRK